MKLKVAYRIAGLDIEMPDQVKVLEPPHLPALDEEKRQAFEAFEAPIGTPPLRFGE